MAKCKMQGQTPMYNCPFSLNLLSFHPYVKKQRQKSTFGYVGWG